jgi:signal transduction histidine kinase
MYIQYKTVVMPFISIKIKAIVLLVIIATVPIIVGGAGSVYYWGIVKKLIRDDYLAHARALPMLTDNYMNASKIYLESQAGRLSIISSIADRNLPVLNNTLKNIQNTGQSSNVYVTDAQGTVISSYPYSPTVGMNETDKPYVHGPLKDMKVCVSAPILSEYTKNHTIYIGVPIQDESGEVLGALIGWLDLHNYSSFTGEWMVDTGNYTFLVDGSGIIIALYGGQNIDMMGKNISDYPGIREVLRGEEGVYEQYNLAINETQVIAFSPVKNYGMGILTAIPAHVAYHPIQDATTTMVLLLIILMLAAFTIAIIVGRYLVKPIINMSRATREMPSGDYLKFLPIGRQDEIGDLARSFDSMATTIRAGQQKIMAARDAAEEEKNKTEFYLDLMGHDINNLNQIALGSLELIKEDTNLTDRQRRFIEKAISAAGGSASIIKNVRSVQKITGEKEQPTLIDINGLISLCIKEAPRPADKKVTVRYTPREGMFIRGTPLAKEIFCNLINNSIKYSGKEVDIDISVDDVAVNGKMYYQIAISDNGYGIPDDIKVKLFRRFQRGMLKAEGKGLGLYIVKTLTEKLGGKVWLEDRVPGDYSKGTKFIVQLPVSS